MIKRDDLLILQMRERISLIEKFLKGVSEQKFLKSQLLQSAVVRELEVLGEAARMISPETKTRFSDLPWQQMTAMRNRLIHGYFSVDFSIVWEVARYNLGLVDKGLERIYRATAAPVHPWRKCPQGYYFVRSHDRKVKRSIKNPDGSTSVHEHCRRNPSGKDQLYPDEIRMIESEHLLRTQVGKLPSPSHANDFDASIATWVHYWNEIFPTENAPLTAETVKALIMSESSFNPNAKAKASEGNFARGLTQITDQTRKILADEKGEIKDHYITLTAKDLSDSSVAICSSIRWLFHKKTQADAHLKRNASWEEAVAHYKAYLLRKKNWKTQKGMINFYRPLEEMEKARKGL